MGVKTKEQNDQAWKNWYNYQNSKGEYVNRKIYLKKKLIRKIEKGQNIKIETARSYGLVDYIKKNGNKKQKDKLKEDLRIEEAIYSEPQPLVVNEVVYKKADPYIPKPLEAQAPETLPSQNFPEPVYDDVEPPQIEAEPEFQEDNIFDIIDDEATTTEDTTDYATIDPDVGKKVNKARKKESFIEKAKKTKLPKFFKFTLADAKAVLLNPNLISRNTTKPYPERTVKGYFSKLTTLTKVMNCDPGKDIKSCLQNPRTLKKKMLDMKTAGEFGKKWVKRYKKKGFDENSIKDYLNPVVVLGNSSLKFRKHLGEETFKKYEEAMTKGIQESSDKQEELVETAKEIRWEIFLNSFKSQEKRYKELVKKVKKEKRELTFDEKVFITDFLLLATPILRRPLRDDWGNLRIVDKRPPNRKNEKQNFYVKNNRLILLNSYKTKKIYGQREFLLKKGTTNGKDGDKLGTYINQTIDLWDRDYVIAQPNGKRYGNGKLSSRLSKAMERFGIEANNPNLTAEGKPQRISYNNFRHSYVAWTRGKNERGKPRTTPAQRREIAEAMLHSKTMSDKYDRLVNHYLLEEEK